MKPTESARGRRASTLETSSVNGSAGSDRCSITRWCRMRMRSHGIPDSDGNREARGRELVPGLPAVLAVVAQVHRHRHAQLVDGPAVPLVIDPQAAGHGGHEGVVERSPRGPGGALQVLERQREHVETDRRWSAPASAGSAARAPAGAGAAGRRRLPGRPARPPSAPAAGAGLRAEAPTPGGRPDRGSRRRGGGSRAAPRRRRRPRRARSLAGSAAGRGRSASSRERSTRLLVMRTMPTPSVMLWCSFRISALRSPSSPSTT